MRRLSSLLRDLRGMFPEDSYLKHHDRKIRESVVLRRWHNAYERVLATLDTTAWDSLRTKAIFNFPSSDSQRGKQALFDHLNEAFAYRFLLRSGYEAISFVDEAAGNSKKGKRIRSPDLQFMQNQVLRYCEVKTINISNDQIEREERTGVVFDGSIFQLSTQFFGKLKYCISSALGQFKDFGGSGMVFLVIHADDRALDDLDEYKTQIGSFAREHFPTVEIVVKFGIYGRIHLHLSNPRPNPSFQRTLRDEAAHRR